MKLAHAIEVVRQQRRYRYRNCRAPHPRGAFLRHTLIPHVTRAEFDQAVDAQKNAMGKMVSVPVEALKTTQRCLAFRRLLRQLRLYPNRKVPIVVRLANGTYVIWDGNHRAVAAILLGAKRVRCLCVGKGHTPEMIRHMLRRLVQARGTKL